MNIKVVGVDPGLAATGIGIVSGRAHKATGYAFGAIRTSPQSSQGSRLERIYSRLRDLIADEKPDLMVIEDVFSLDEFPQSAITLGKVCGVILLAAYQAGLDVHAVAVREAKQVLTGNGSASKEQLERAVRHTLGCDQVIRPYHASDALGLALIGLFRYAGHRLDRAERSKEKKVR